MKSEIMDIGENTKIPLFAALIALPIILGGMAWLTTIDNKASAAQDELRGSRQLLERYQDRLDSIDRRLSHIEGELTK